MIVQQEPELSVVIVNFYSERQLLRCLRSIAHLPERVEVVVVDNGSDPERCSALRKACPGLLWRRMGRNAGFSAACNAGAAAASSDLLLFLNPDTVVLPDALSRLVGALVSEPYRRAILGCAIRNEDGSIQLSCRSFPTWRTFLAGRFSLLTRLFPNNRWSAEYLMTGYDHSTVRRVDWVSGAAIGMRRETFLELGGFDERYFVYFEDVDLCRRAAERGIPTYYYPEACVQHSIGGSSQGVPYLALAYRHRSMWTYYRRHLGNGWLDPVAGLLIAARLGVLAAREWIAHALLSPQEPGLETQKSAE